jgi:ubiquinone/menaquinone biosynthesis C-methylase UbiE/uncharacterized protein YbaR (Trm112 family)
LDVLDCIVCPVCRGGLSEDRAALVCSECGSRFDVVDGIPLLMLSTTLNTRLDVATYARLAHVGPQAVANTHNEYRHALAAAGQTLQGSLLEIGTGTGLLTEAMMRHADFDRIISTDVSIGFLEHTKARLSDVPSSVAFVACDGNTLPFRNGGFDVVLGRSVLHHLLHYQETLRRIHDLLRPGGVVAFYEPVQSGKAVICFLFRIILGMDEQVGPIGLTPNERTIMTRAVRNMMRTATTEHSDADLAKIEDKYVFDIEKLCTQARALGFATARYVNSPVVDRSYFGYLSMHMRNYGIRPEIVTKLGWLKSAFADTIGAVAGARLSAPMGYFVFERAAAVPAQIWP